MRFALLGDHPDGLAMARALVSSGRHEVSTYTGTSAGADALKQAGITAQPVRDLEEVLADPAIEAVIIASTPGQRPMQLRRVLQSERHVLCVHPADQTPDTAYEAALIQGDTGSVLLPLLPDALHPAIVRLNEMAQDDDSSLGTLQLVEWMLYASENALAVSGAGDKPSLPGWDILRAVGGEIAEVSAFASLEDLSKQDAVLLSGRFAQGALFQAAYLPRQQTDILRMALVGSMGRAELTYATGLQGPSLLRVEMAGGVNHEEHWPAWSGWSKLVEIFEAALALPNRRATEPAQPRTISVAGLSWQTEVRSLELDDAARRSVHRRRTSTMEYPEATEEAGFKGTMTLVGCGIIWGIILLLILSIWVPWLGWLIIPLLTVFLGLQILRWIVPKSAEDPSSGEHLEQVPRE